MSFGAAGRRREGPVPNGERGIQPSLAPNTSLFAAFWAHAGRISLRQSETEVLGLPIGRTMRPVKRTYIMGLPRARWRCSQAEDDAERYMRLGVNDWALAHFRMLPTLGEQRTTIRGNVRLFGSFAAFTFA